MFLASVKNSKLWCPPSLLTLLFLIPPNGARRGALFGIAFTIIHPIIQAWALTLVPPEKKATANSMLLIFINSGMVIGSVALQFLSWNCYLAGI